MAPYAAYAAIPFITAFIGWLTNKVAIKMLFRPRDPVRFLGMTFQGLIPRRHEEMAERAGEIIEAEFLSHHMIREEIDKIELGPHLDRYASVLIHQKVGPRLKALPLLGSFVNPSTLTTIERMAAEEMRKEAPKLLEKMADELESRIEIKQLVRDRVSAFELDKLEEVVHRIAQDEFRTIELLGGVLGFVIGLAQVGLLVVL